MKHIAILALTILSLTAFGACGSSDSSSGTTYTVGGTLSGLSGTLVLQNNTADDLSLTADGAFAFVTALADAAAYAVTVLTNPTGQTCTVADGSGTVSGANVTNVTVTCATDTYSIGGTASGLIGTVVLQNNAGDNLSVTANSTFTFATKIAYGAAYAVTVLTNPTNQTCTASSGSGTVGAANVTNVSVACVDTNPRIFITSSTFTGNLVSVSDADASCMSDANYPGAGTYKAFIVDGTVRRACTTANCGGGPSEHIGWVLAATTTYVRSDGTTVIKATNNEAIFSFAGAVLTNSFSATSYNIWTGLTNNWTGNDNADCTNWTSAIGAGEVGNTSATDGTAIQQAATLNCSGAASVRLACVEQL